MTSSAAKVNRRGPVSVVLPDELLARVATEARRRGLKLSPAVRTLVTERVDELEDQQRLSAAEEWQRREAWATWESVKRGRATEVNRDKLQSAFASARRAKK